MKGIKMKRGIVFLQIFLLVSFSFSFSYILKESSDVFVSLPVQRTKSHISGKIMYIIGKIIFGTSGIVSALQASDLSAGTWTCPESKSGVFCQEFIASECNQQCKTECIPSERNNVAQCKIGTCYDPNEGTCNLGTPQSVCTASNGTWFDDPNGNVPQCQRGCCLINQESSFITEQQCNRRASLLGSSKIYRPEIHNELQCLALAQSQTEGACVYGTSSDGKNLCRFTTKGNCLQTIRGSFHEGFLCSHPELNSVCEKQKSTGCVNEKDEVYWFDSCGNRENIYDAQKPRSWNDGKILSKEQSCSLNSGDNPLANARICGNCNLFQSSVCKRANTGEVSIGEFVCKGISCTDSNGNRRENGESWCRYQGSTGLDGNRATDSVGSRQFRETCYKGEVSIDACADYRNEICTESKTEANGKSFSTAACRINRWQECLNYNSPAHPELKDKCGENPDCFVKSVNVDTDFKFSVCAPKYPPGFQLDENGRGDGAEGMCSIGTQSCTKVMVKKLFRGWVCMANCNCDKEVFTKQMNDFCISLGDCGAKADYLGDVQTNGYVVSGAPKLDASYLGTLQRYADESLFKNKFIPMGNLAQQFSSLGRPDYLGFATEPIDPTTQTRADINLPLGAAGTVAGLAAMAGYSGALGTFYIATETGAVVFTEAGLYALGDVGSVVVVPFLQVLAGAAAGFALTSWLLDVTGVGRGLPPAVTYSLIAAGTVGGAIMVISALANPGGLSTLYGACATGFGCIVVIVVVFIILLLKLFGIGKVKKIGVDFSCSVWQPPNGGANCNKCGSDGLPCSPYACQSLGQTCALINENTDEAECIDSNPNDVGAPIINPLIGAISANHQYEDVSTSGFKIRNLQSGKGCLEPYTNLRFGLNLNEPGQCRASSNSATPFDEMDQFGASALFRMNHSIMLPVPDLRAFEYHGYIPSNASSEYTWFIRCQDKRGNVNANAYAINFCVQKDLDLTPPRINLHEPVYNYVAYNATSQNIKTYINEPAECRWGNSDREYNLLGNPLNCSNDIEDQGVYGWKCETTVPLIAHNDSSFFIRCKDQPWINTSVVVFSVNNREIKYYTGDINYTYLREINGGTLNGITNITLNETRITDLLANNTNRTQSRNINTQGYPIVLHKSLTPLRINSLTPNNQTILFGTIPASVTINAQTSGGVDGKAECSYWYGNRTIQFANTWGTNHVQIFNSMYPGNVVLPIICKDLAGNSAEQTARFKVELDNSPPRVTRAYSAGTVLVVVTNEPAQCTYSERSCEFEYTNASAMSGTQNIHNTALEKDKTYYVKCRDQFMHGPGSACSIIVRRSQLDA